MNIIKTKSIKGFVMFAGGAKILFDGGFAITKNKATFLTAKEAGEINVEVVHGDTATFYNLVETEPEWIEEKQNQQRMSI